LRTLLLILDGGSTNALNGATIGLVALWFAIAATNLWVGVHSAGYAYREEMPIFPLIVLVPLALTALARWKWQ